MHALGLATPAQQDRALVLHRLVAAFIRGAIGTEVGEAARAAVEQVVVSAASAINKHGDPRPLLAWQPQLRAIAEAAERDGRPDAPGLLNQLGNHLHTVADLAGARAALERALAIDERVHGPDHPTVATTVNNLGLVLRPSTKKVRPAVTETVGAAVPIEAERGTLRLVDEPSAPKKARYAPTRAGDRAAAPKRRGRPPKAAAGAEPPRVQTNPVVGIGPAKLIKKAELAVKPAPQEAPPAPAARIRPERISQPVERRPFRNVEVRTPGPGRGHNRTRRMPSGSAV